MSKTSSLLILFSQFLFNDIIEDKLSHVITFDPLKIYRYCVDIQAESGRWMSYDIARSIFNDAIELEQRQQKQVIGILLGGNNLRKWKQGSNDVLDMFEFLLRKTRKIQGFHLFVATANPSPESAHIDNGNYKDFDSKLEALVETFPKSQFSFLNRSRAFPIQGSVVS